MATIPELNAIERKKLVKQSECLYKLSHFTQDETLLLLYRYHGLTSDKIDRVLFCDLLHDWFGMTDDYFMDKVFKAFDKDSDGFLNQEEWVKGLSMFLRGTLAEKIEYCFSIYDLNSDGYITREEMFHMLKNTLIKQPTEEDPEEGIKELIEILMKKMDHDNDSKVSLQDFKTTVEAERLLIEAFGPCLPEEKYCERFAAETLTRI
ncbi:PREDICTED: EF-hand calcium-binding domain-containing protein 1-like [Amphimedon queenslandica]|uniref:EF-hand domain-containing protein n=1 Tax=Amphimedon queenslandica TaxID=400682 RepID=A0A1X7VML3_AMPQE|nr:PREDICTED: EF-hand calcium-binding domain-containing protein 1-like [Amphimedon queenslandica]|eukprot:XP_003383675.1 PREDICTED: EF-hand calcium-binding domain-containing protein 1-like [Amphimedon queenslandica]